MIPENIKTVAQSRLVFIALGLALLLFFSFTNTPDGIPVSAWRLLGVILLMILLWISEVLPFAIIALLPLITFPLFDITAFNQVCLNYGNPVIFLFLGGFLMACALEKTGLHKRISLVIIYYTGRSFAGVFLGFMLSTAFLSMWISNTATTVMMASIAVPAMKWLLPNADEPSKKIFASYFLLSIAYASGIGGITTIIGTPPNAVLYGLLNTNYGISLSFAGWVTYAFPIAAIMFLITYLLFKRSISKLDHLPLKSDFRPMVLPELKALGPLTWSERSVLVIFSVAILLWMFRSLINTWIGKPLIDDAMIAIAAGITPFFIPEKGKASRFVMEWEHTRDLPWNILLLFGGGLALASAMGSTGLVSLTADWLVNELGTAPLLFLIILPLVMLFLTELMGNVALATLFLPLTFQVAGNLGLPLQYFAFPVTIASSFAFMLPIATPPNAIVYSKGYFSVQFMMGKGIWLNIAGWIVLCLITYLYFL
jgi:sodium-dependent dicarboxylate transporter 2/3/5